MKGLMGGSLAGAPLSQSPHALSHSHPLLSLVHLIPPAPSFWYACLSPVADAMQGCTMKGLMGGSLACTMYLRLVQSVASRGTCVRLVCDWFVIVFFNQVSRRG